MVAPFHGGLEDAKPIVVLHLSLEGVSDAVRVVGPEPIEEGLVAEKGRDLAQGS